MTRTAQINRAIVVWKLTAEEYALVRWMPPESFLPAHAAIGVLAPVLTGEPDFVKEHPAFFAPRPRLRPVTLPELDALEKIGTPDGPATEVAVGLLRRARTTHHEMTAASAVMRAAGPVPEAVRLEAAYLFAARQAARSLRSRSSTRRLRNSEHHPTATGASAREPRAAAAPPADTTAGLLLPSAKAIVREAEVWGRYLARHRAQQIPGRCTPIPRRRAHRLGHRAE